MLRITLLLIATLALLAACSGGDEQLVTRLEAELAGASAQVTDLNAEVDALEDDIAAQDQELREEQARTRQLTDALAEAQATIAETEAAIARLEEELGDLQRALADTPETVTPHLPREIVSDIALGLEDLPEGASLESEEFEVDADGDVEFNRSFDVTFVPFGSSQLLGLGSQINVAGSTVEASILLPVVLDLLSQGALVAALANQFAGGPALGEPESEVLQLDLGDESGAVILRTDSLIGELTIVFVLVRVERGIGILTGTGLTNLMDAQDVMDLGQVMARKMDDARSILAP